MYFAYRWAAPLPHTPENLDITHSLYVLCIWFVDDANSSPIVWLLFTNCVLVFVVQVFYTFVLYISVSVCIVLVADVLLDKLCTV